MISCMPLLLVSLLRRARARDRGVRTAQPQAAALRRARLRARRGARGAARGGVCARPRALHFAATIFYEYDYTPHLKDPLSPKKVRSHLSR